MNKGDVLNLWCAAAMAAVVILGGYLLIVEGVGRLYAAFGEDFLMAIFLFVAFLGLTATIFHHLSGRGSK